MSNIQNKVVVVTGASRGAGKGIALALGEAGATVYVTGRSTQEDSSPLPGTIYETAEQITARGGNGIAVVCDHSNDDQVKALFEQVKNEQGKIDILVNNACAVPDELIHPGPFWEKSLNMLDILDVGMRSHYTSTYYAAPLLIEAGKTGSALAVHTSSFGGRCYMHGPAYGAGKAAVDKFANDMAIDFKPFNVGVVSIWMGLIATERTLDVMSKEPDKYEGAKAVMETPEFTGRVINALFNDDKMMEKSGQILVGAEEALAYGVTDIDGRQPPSHAGQLGNPAQANPAVVE